MSETSSDAESSCGWTIISNEGSDIETLGSEVAVEYGAEALERHPVEEAELQDAQASAAGDECVRETAAASLDDTLGEQTLDETLCTPEAEGKEQVLSFSDHSDIVTLGDLKEEEHGEVEVKTISAATNEFYLGSSSSSQYTFTAAEPAFSAQQPTVTNSSSSEDEAGPSTSPVIRRRRLRKNTTSLMTDEEKDEATLESHLSEDEDIREHRKHQEEEEQTEVGSASICVKSRLHNIFITCVLLILLVVFCLSFSHFYSAAFHDDPDKFKFVCPGEVNIEPEDNVHKLREKISELKEHNLEFLAKLRHTQAQRDELQVLLKKKMEERINLMPEQQLLSEENEQLKKSLEREEKSVATLQEEQRKLRSQIKSLQEIGAEALLSENQRLKKQLHDKKQMNRNFQSQKEDMMAEAQTLRKKLDTERTITEELRRELAHLRTRISGARQAANSETEELQSRLMELEKRLSFEQQRSDLWERLYVETKEDRAKGDTEPKVKRTKRGMAGKMKETIDAIKNSTKDFVHHHKEQIKKAKEAVKENLQKFSDSVKSTFRNFKDSASTFINKARGLYNKKRNERNSRESWQHRPHKPHKSDSFHSNHNTRKSGGKVHEDEGHNGHKASLNGCSGVFNCAYQESMTLFNTAIEPIRADEFYQLLQSYLLQEVEHFDHWKELDTFIKNFFHNGVFIHDQMLFTDFVNGVEEYLAEMHEYHGLDNHVFEDFDDYVYRHFFGEANARTYWPSRPFERPNTASKDESKVRNQQRKQQRAKSRAHGEGKWSRAGRKTDRHMADVKIELGPMPFDPKY